MTLANVATTFTLSFCREHLGERPRRLLEIGCGAGELARTLQDLGHDVAAIDSDPAMVASARALGVAAHEASWPEFAGGSFDAILFTRSLHHVASLAPSLGRAHDALNPGGLLLVEDFAFSDADARTILWFCAALRELGVTSTTADTSFARRLLAATDPCSIWHRQHEHRLHGAEAMRTAIVRRFELRLSLAVPYLFRYASDALIDDCSGPEQLQQLLAREAEAIARGAIKGVGRRFVAVRQ